jgi:hypothetical protein
MPPPSHKIFATGTIIIPTLENRRAQFSLKQEQERLKPMFLPMAQQLP